MRQPLVAVPAYHLVTGRVTRWSVGAYAVPETYVVALRRAGLGPVILPGPGDLAPGELAATFDGLLLAGGGDVQARRYGAERDPQNYGEDDERDALEIDLLLAASENGLPTLAICRGIQVMNVAFGGDLIQHLPDHPGSVSHGLPTGDPAVHEVKVLESSRLARASGEAAMTCASSHHQGLGRLGEGLAAVAWSDDGLVEAAERESGWMLGVQWHPEETVAKDPAQQAIFDAFAAEARAFASARRG
jgi:putative glutamine amidotransferase